MQNIKKQESGRDRWYWFSVGYACAIEISIGLLYKVSGGTGFEGYGIGFIIAVIALVAMLALKG